MVGICRGAQFLNVMGGGRMYQHVEGHCRNHLITDLETGKEVYVSSTHHQMMMPSPGAILVATAAIGGSREWMEDGILTKDVSDKDIEVVFYENIQALCVQFHPEFTGESCNGMFNYFGELLKRYVDK